MNPHCWLTAIDPPCPIGATAEEGARRRWQCQYCPANGTMDELHQIECTYVYPPCSVCGQTPECAKDCKFMAAIMGSPAVHVVGAEKPKLPEA